MCEIKIFVKKVEKRQPVEKGKRVKYESLEYHAGAEFTLRSDSKLDGNVIKAYQRNMFTKVQESIDLEKKADGLSSRAPLISEDVESYVMVDGKTESLAVV